MSAESSTLPLHQSSDYRAILWGGLSAGILDIMAAIINTAIRTGRGPLWVLQSVASAILGANSYEGGLASEGQFGNSWSVGWCQKPDRQGGPD